MIRTQSKSWRRWNRSRWSRRRAKRCSRKSTRSRIWSVRPNRRKAFARCSKRQREPPCKWKRRRRIGVRCFKFRSTQKTTTKIYTKPSTTQHSSSSSIEANPKQIFVDRNSSQTFSSRKMKEKSFSVLNFPLFTLLVDEEKPVTDENEKRKQTFTIEMNHKKVKFLNWKGNPGKLFLRARFEFFFRVRGARKNLLHKFKKKRRWRFQRWNNKREIFSFYIITREENWENSYTNWNVFLVFLAHLAGGSLSRAMWKSSIGKFKFFTHQQLDSFTSVRVQGRVGGTASITFLES